MSDWMHPPEKDPPGDMDIGVPTSCHVCGGGTTYQTLAQYGHCEGCEEDERKRLGKPPLDPDASTE